jgi:hypothetical protein
MGLHGGIYDSWKEILLSDLRELYDRSLPTSPHALSLWTWEAKKEISLNQSVDVSNFAQTPDGQSVSPIIIDSHRKRSAFNQ